MTGTPPSRDPFEVGVEHVTCVVCAADDPRPYQERMYAIGAHTFDMVRCQRCGLVYADPRPDGPTLGRMYDDPDYYTHGYNLGVEDTNYFERKDELLAQYDGEVAVLEKETGGQGALLELGSAGGFFIEAARRRGWDVKGIELSPPAAKYSIDELDLPVFEGLLEDAPYAPRSFDLTIADNVLEHTTDPGHVLRDLFELTRPGGHLLVIVPSYVNSPFFRIIAGVRKLLPKKLLGQKLLALLKMDDDSDGGYPYHILEFDHATLLTLVRGAGYQVADVERSVPFPAHLFKKSDPSLVDRCLRGVFRTLDRLMRWGLLPGARLRVLARRP